MHNQLIVLAVLYPLKYYMVCGVGLLVEYLDQLYLSFIGAIQARDVSREFPFISRWLGRYASHPPSEG
jgi:hypothetical protein